MKKILKLIGMFIISIILNLTGPLKFMELKSIDSRFRIRGERKPPPSILIVAIDDESYEVLKRRFPWPRNYYAHLLKNLKRAGAKMVLFDIEFDAPDPENDTTFAKSIKEFKWVVLGKKILKDNEVLPAEPLRIAYTGFLNKIYDPDGFVRRYPVRIGEEISLALSACKILGKDIDFPDIINLNFYGPKQTFPYHSFWTIMDDSSFLIPGIEEEPDELNVFYELLKDSVFYGKIVLIGVTIPEFHDYDQTPFYLYSGKKSPTPGVEIHATALANMLEGERIKNFYGWKYYLVIFIFSLIFLLIPYERVILSSSILLLILSFYSLLSIFFFLHSILIPIIPFYTISILLFTQGMLEQYLIIQHEKKKVKMLFSRYISKELMEKLLKNPSIELGGEERILTVMFSDIENFTSFSEERPPYEVVELINWYLTELTNIIFRYRGMVNKYEGDAIMAIFGAPVFYEDHAELSVLCAMEMQKKVKELWERGFPRLRTRIGINTGKMIVGNVGSYERLEYTVIGDAVNIASRLEGANKFYGTSILLGEETGERIKDRIMLREIDLIKVKGKKRPIRVYEPLPEEKTHLKKPYEEALLLYRERRWEDALKIFEKLAPYDPPSMAFVERIKELIKNPPPPDWDGVFTAKKK